MNTEEKDLLAEGIAAASVGDHEEAQRLLRRATELTPTNVEAWVWRATVANNTADKKSFLEEALRLNPAHREAQMALKRIEQKEGPVSARLAEEETLYCTIHPDRETMLRCNRCGRPMCIDCAVRHPVGLRCRECVSQTKSVVYQVDRGTFVKALLAALVVGTLVGFLVILFGRPIWFFFWFFIGGAIGRGVAEAVQRIVPRKRGRPVQMAVGIGMVGGLLIAALILGGGNPIPFLLQLSVLLYIGTAVTAAVASLR